MHAPSGDVSLPWTLLLFLLSGAGSGLVMLIHAAISYGARREAQKTLTATMTELKLAVVDFHARVDEINKFVTEFRAYDVHARLQRFEEGYYALREKLGIVRAIEEERSGAFRTGTEPPRTKPRGG